jgi:hypothetical protein
MNFVIPGLAVSPDPDTRESAVERNVLSRGVAPSGSDEALYGWL